MKSKLKSVESKLKSIESKLKSIESKLKSIENFTDPINHSDPGPSKKNTLNRHQNLF